MNHYETLDVPRDASRDDIKRAYRKKAGKSHPDRGGSDEQMAALNLAVAVLEDPARREHYDRVGEDAPDQPPIESLARMALFSLFKRVLDDAGDKNIVEVISRYIGAKKEELLHERHKVQAKRERVVKRRGKIKTVDGIENIVHTIIDEQIRACDAELLKISEAEAVMTHCAVMLKSYRDETQFEPPRSGFTTRYVTGLGKF